MLKTESESAKGYECERGHKTTFAIVISWDGERNDVCPQCFAESFPTKPRKADE